MTYPNIELFIDGVWRAGSDADRIAVFNPATGAQIGSLAKAGADDIEEAAQAAARGFAKWRRETPFARAAIMRKATALLRSRAPEIARLMTQEQGKPLPEAQGEINAAADMLDWFADEGCRVYGRTVPSRLGQEYRQTVVMDPVGPVAAFSPWNFPINQVARKIGPALATGCSVVLKAPEETPASPAALIQAFHDAGLPKGVLNLIFGNPAQISESLIAHPAIRKITFTGSTAVGKQLASLAGAQMKRVSMELGGHAPVIICADADLDLAVRTMSAAKFRNAGQVCISPTRFLVHESIAEEFGRRMAEFASGLRLGDGLDAQTQMGPLANGRRITAMQALTEDALAQGAKLLTGGAVATTDAQTKEGHFWQPTVLANVTTSAKVMNEEPFGPIVAISPFAELEDAIAEANRLPYGLAGYAFTSTLKNAEKLSREVEVGMLWLNMPAAASAELPFGGLRDSGYGTEGGPEALAAYLNIRTIGAFTG